MGRLYAVALSFANLVYLLAWGGLAAQGPQTLWYRKTLPTPQQYAAVAADVLALSIVTYAVLRVAAKLPPWLRRILLAAALLAVAFPLLPFAAAHLPFRSPAPRQLAALAAAAALVVVGVIFRCFDWAARAARKIALAALLSVPVTFAGVGIAILARPPLAPDPLPAARLPGGPPVRILWLIFDEWDQRLSFTHRLPGTALPAIDRLASMSFVGTRALAAEAGRPVGTMSTAISMPSLLYSRSVAAAQIVDTAHMDLVFADGGRARFGEAPNYFSLARARGWNAAVGGWYLPYCPSFGSQVSSCYWDQLYDRSDAAGAGFAEASWQETELLVESALLAPFGQRLTAFRHASEYKALAGFARRTAADPGIGVALVHFNIPHGPYFYNSANGRSDVSASGAAGYDAALQLVDRTVAEVLEALARSGLDGKTALILSADHPARFPTRIDGGEDVHVPFIVHLPGGQTGMAFDGEFSALATVPLALAVAAGEVATPEAVAKFVTERGVRP
jgi:hypothetical protein